MLLSNNKLRYAISVCVAVICSIVLAFYFAKEHIALIPLVAVYVMQTSIGNSLYQGLRKFFIIFFIVGVAAIAVHSMLFFYVEMRDVLLGVMIGIAANLLIFPRKADIAFRQQITAVLMVYQQYVIQTLETVRGKSELPSNAELEQAILNLPSWVYERGFDVGLQVGYQFFLVKLEQIADVLFALHSLARYRYESDLLQEVDEALVKCEEQICIFISSMTQVLQLKKLAEGARDFSAELTVLEKQFYQIAPSSLELLDIRLDYVYFAELIYCLQDLHQYLVRLGEALR